MKFIKFV